MLRVLERVAFEVAMSIQSAAASAMGAWREFNQSQLLVALLGESKIQTGTEPPLVQIRERQSNV